MKKHLLKIGAACLALSLAFQVSAQKELTIYSIDEAPVADGDKSEWADIMSHDIDQVWKPGDAGEQIVSMTDDAVPTFKIVWDETNVYVLVEVPDDDFYPAAESGKASWLSDKPELYFDVNAELVDGGGPSDDAGHYQFAGGFEEDQPDNGSTFAYDKDLVNGDDSKAYFVEYFIPLATLVDDADAACDGSRKIGFDVTIIDLDEEGKGLTTVSATRINYNNDVLVDESWSTMDYAAIAEFSYDAQPVSVIEKASNVNVLRTNTVENELDFSVEVTNVRVFNSVGQVVSTDANVSSLNAGVYIVAVETANGAVANRFVKK